MKAIVVFNTTHQTLKAEKLLKSLGIRIRPVPKPTWISSACGLALEFYLRDQEEILSLCQKNSLDLQGIYRLEG
ncbi:MAG: DUF3343 domain-containing protein [Candidatus Hydrothermarchaeales archaeon]